MCIQIAAIMLAKCLEVDEIHIVILCMVDSLNMGVALWDSPHFREQFHQSYISTVKTNRETSTLANWQLLCQTGPTSSPVCMGQLGGILGHWHTM